MQRITAKLTLLLIALGVFQPVLEAFSREIPHACCLRRLHSRPYQKQFDDARTTGGNCCPPLIVPHTANLTARKISWFSPQVAILKLSPRNNAFVAESRDQLSARAPPALIQS